MLKITITWLPEFQMPLVSTGVHRLYLMDKHIYQGFLYNESMFCCSKISSYVLAILVCITPDVGATKHGLITKRDFSHKIQLGAVLKLQITYHSCYKKHHYF